MITVHYKSFSLAGALYCKLTPLTDPVQWELVFQIFFPIPPLSVGSLIPRLYHITVIEAPARDAKGDGARYAGAFG